METVAESRVEATTTLGIIQESAHVRARRCGRTDAAERGSELLGLRQPLLAPRGAELALGLRPFEEHPTLGASDAALATAAMLSGADALVSADRAFAGIRGLTWMDPAGPQLRDLLTE